MEEKEYKRLTEFEKHYWWHVGRRKIIETLIKKHIDVNNDLNILEVGCGTGGNYQLLKKFGKVTGIDNSESALTECQKNNWSQVSLQDCQKTNFSDNTFDLILALDLLEHLSDPQSALAEFKRLVKNSKNIIITVPAYQFLWSQHDESLHHKKRYNLKQLIREIKNADFEVVKASYIISTLAVPIISVRYLEKLLVKIIKFQKKSSYIILPKSINKILTLLLYLEAQGIKYFNFPFGISIVCIARKK